MENVSRKTLLKALELACRKIDEIADHDCILDYFPKYWGVGEERCEGCDTIECYKRYFINEA